MTLISTIIADAYRESNMIPLGKAPSVNQVTEALRLFNTVLASTYGGDVGENLGDWPLGAFGRPADAPPMILPVSRLAHPPLNSRLIATNDAAMTVTLTLMPQDGARFAIVDPFGRLASAPLTVNAAGRTIEGTPTIVVATNGTFREWVYRADLGGWKRVNDVLATDDMPFPARFDAMFTILLAMRLNPRYGRSLDPQSAAVLKDSRQEFVARYLQSDRLETDDSISWPFLSRQSYSTGRSFSSTTAFSQGRPF